MKMRDFRDLKVWRRSMLLAEEVYAATRDFPKDELFGLVGQLRRAAVSIPSNIAEGHGRASDKNFALFLTQARGSLCELQTQLELSRNLGMVEAQRAEHLLAGASEVARMLHGLLRTLRQPTPRA
jgi:four helix bundle protein